MKRVVNEMIFSLGAEEIENETEALLTICSFQEKDTMLAGFPGKRFYGCKKMSIRLEQFFLALRANLVERKKFFIHTCIILHP